MNSLTNSNIGSSSRPSTQSSIQSSNPDLLKKRPRTSTKSSNKANSEDDYGEFQGCTTYRPQVHEDLGTPEFDFENTADEFYKHDAISPLHDYKDSTDLAISSGVDYGSGLDFLNNLPSSSITYAHQKISSDLRSGEEQISPFPNSEFTSSSKLTSCAINFDELSTNSKNAYNRLRLIEELMETEESYISSMKMLTNIYLESLILKGSDGIPIRLIHDYVSILVSNHQSFLTSLRSLFFVSYKNNLNYNINSPHYRLKSREYIAPSSPLMAVLVSELVVEKAISIYLYQQLTSLHSMVLKLMTAKESDPEFGSTLTRGYQVFLEASQGSDNRMDLSFSSLIQKPISRISKYKLFLNTLSKLTPFEDDPSSNLKIQECAKAIGEKIGEVNRDGLREQFKSDLLFQYLYFSPKTLNFPVEYLGLPILSGSLDCVWVGKDRQVQSQVFGAFLFKTHLVLANVPRENKYEVKFLIPLSICKIVEACDSLQGGLYTVYESCFKLVFEHHYTLIEILCIQFEHCETTVWKDKLEILIDYVNGPYRFDYSSSKLKEELGTKCSTIVPIHIQPFNCMIDKFRTFRLSKSNIFSRCYFKDIIPLKVEKITGNNDGTFHRSKSLRKSSTQLTAKINGGFLIQLKFTDRTRIEYLLQGLWSDELLSVEMMDRRIQHPNPKLQLKKQSSSLSLRSFGSRHSWSHHRHQPEQDVQVSPVELQLSLDKSNEPVTQQEEGKEGTTEGSISIMRRTSIVFGSALKSIMSGSDH